MFEELYDRKPTAEINDFLCWLHQELYEYNTKLEN